MKILAFAHVTLTGSPEQGTKQNLSFQSVSNPTWKSKYMKDFSNLHDIILVGGGITIEYVKYKNTGVCSQTFVKDVVNLDGITIYSRDFSEQFFLLVSEVGDIEYSIGNDFIMIPNTFPNRPIRLKYQHNGKAFNDYLDDEGLTGIAFYVNSVQEVSNFFEQRYSGKPDFDLSTIIELQLDLTAMKIVLIRWGGITIEFIERKRKSC